MRVVQPAERMRERVDGAEPALEGGGAHGRGHQHVATRVEIGPLLHGPREILLDEPHALERDARRKRMVEGRAIGLDDSGPARPCRWPP